MLVWLELTGTSIWVRESQWGFVIPLIVHSLALAMLSGLCFVSGLRVMGVASTIALDELFCRTRKLVIACFLACLLSGLFLLLGYPAKALTNPLFWLKLLLIGIGLFLYFSLASRSRDRAGQRKGLALMLLLVWAGVIFSGRLLAYTYHLLMASEGI